DVGRVFAGVSSPAAKAAAGLRGSRHFADESPRAMVRRHRQHRLHLGGGDVEPLSLAVRQRRKAQPMQHFRFVAVKLEGQVRRCSIHKKYSAAISLAFDEEPPDAMARDTVEVVFASL